MTDYDQHALVERLEAAGQSHLLQWWDELNPERRGRLAAQIAAIDFEQIAALTPKSGCATAEESDSAADRAGQPGNLLRLDDEADDERHRARAVGEELLAAGKVGAVLVAGGQGSRLGFDEPKGMFPIGPVTDRSLFQIFAEQLLARSRKAGATIPWFVMTSAATHDRTVSFFEEHDRFGLPGDSVFFFQQGTMPAVDSRAGRILMNGRDEIALSPDGHGGLLAALQRSDLFAEMDRRGIECLFYHQVDNPATVVCDPLFLGLHVLRQSQVSTKVVSKTSPEEAMGVVVSVDGQTRIIEYSNLSDDQKAKLDGAGRLWFWAGNTAVHAFDVAFLQRMVGDASALPFHVAHKKVRSLDTSGLPREPETENAWKFERFIFDVLPHATNALVMEVDRASEFLPVKKAEGTDSPATAREGLAKMYSGWLREAGIAVTDGMPVEISPLCAIGPDDLASRRPIEAVDGAIVLRGDC